jgi:hypothetical protein
MEVCWHVMALFRDCLRVSIVADTGEGKVFGAILDSSNPTMTIVIEECGVEDGSEEAELRWRTD